MNEWGEFLVAQVGAAAVLAGFVFVGVSVNLDRVLAMPGVSGRAAEPLIVLLVPLVAASLLLVPGQSTTLIGCELLGSGVAGWIALLINQARSNVTSFPNHRAHFALRVVLGQLAILPFVIAGIAVLWRGEGGIAWIVPGMIFVFILSFIDSWVVLVEINR